MIEATPSNWGPCPPGELGRLTAWLAFRRRLRIAAVVAVALLAGAGLAGAGWFAHSAWREDPPDPCHTAPCCEGNPPEPIPPTPPKK